MHRDDPSFQFGWLTDLYATMWTAVPRPETEARPGVPGERPMENVIHASMRRRCFQEADRILTSNGFVVDDWSRWKVVRAVGAAFQRASLKLKLAAEGEIVLEIPPTHDSLASADRRSDDPSLVSLEPARRTRQSTTSKPLSLTGLFEEWWQEAKSAGRKPSTHESYGKTVRYLVTFLKHNDAARVTAKDIVAFKDHRLATPSKKTGRVPTAKTVKDSDLAALKTLFGWAVVNHKLPSNPAFGMTIKLGKKPHLRGKDFTDEEAEAILARALAYKRSDSEQANTAAAKRWVPWLMAFTGARVGELAQLRRQDVRQHGAAWVIRITPEAGTQKTNDAREIPLHAQLVEIGFPAFVQASAEGPLFLSPGRDGEVLGPLQGIKNRLAEFAREAVPDSRVAPNHGWRHRFKTVGMEAGIAPRILDAIQGQAARTVADTYGEVTLKTMATAIDKLMPFDLERLRSQALDACAATLVVQVDPH